MLGCSAVFVLSSLGTSDCNFTFARQSVVICSYVKVAFPQTFVDIILLSSGIECCCEKSETSLIASFLLILFILSYLWGLIIQLGCAFLIAIMTYLFSLLFSLMFINLSRLYHDAYYSGIFLICMMYHFELLILPSFQWNFPELYFRIFLDFYFLKLRGTNNSYIWQALSSTPVIPYLIALVYFLLVYCDYISSSPKPVYSVFQLCLFHFIQLFLIYLLDL